MTRTTFQRRRRLLQLKHQQLAPFNPILTLMNSWKTTIVGALLAGLAFLSIYQVNGGDLAHWQQWVIPFCVAALGWVAKDNNVSGKVPMILAALLVCILAITSCNTLQRDDAKDTLKAISIQIAEAATKAGAEVALKDAEDKLDKLKAEPVPSSPIAAALRASAIEEAEKLVQTAREKVNAFHFSDLGIK